MPELEEWLAIDPLDPRQLHYRPLRVRLGFKPGSANDTSFLKNPGGCHEVALWPPSRDKNIGHLGLTLSVSEVKWVSAKTVDLYFGAVIEHNWKHISELSGYDRVYRDLLTP